MPKGKTSERKPKKKIVLKKESMPTTVKKTVQPPKKRINIKKTKPVKKPKKKITKCVDVGCLIATILFAISRFYFLLLI